MPDMVKIAAIAVAAALCAVVVKKNVAELGMVLALCAGAIILSCSLGALEGVKELMDTLADTAGLSPAVLAPVVKTVGIAVLTRVSAELCRDAKEGGIAAFVETAGAAAARQMATMLFSTVLMSLITKLLLPLVYGYIAACVAHAAVGNEGLKRIAGVLKWTVTSILTVLLLVFVGYLTVSGVIAGTADAVAVKAAKFTVSSMVPVVGGILSDAAETVLAGAGILKNAVGVFGMLVILSMCVVPFLQLGIHYLAYKLTAALAATVADGRTSGLIDGLGGAFGLILGMTGASAMLLLVSMVSAVSMVTP